MWETRDILRNAIRKEFDLDVFFETCLNGDEEVRLYKYFDKFSGRRIKPSDVDYENTRFERVGGFTLRCLDNDVLAEDFNGELGSIIWRIQKLLHKQPNLVGV